MVQYIDLKIIFYYALAIVCFVSAAEVYAQSYVTRAETVTLLFSAMNQEVPKAHISVAIYPDVVPNSWYAQYMYAALDTGIIDSEPKTGLLYPHRPVTRAQFLKMATLAFALPVGLPHSYLDSQPHMWFNQYIGLAEEYDLFEARGNSHIFPERFIQSEEASKIISTLQQNNPNLRHIQKSDMVLTLQNRLLKSAPLQTVLQINTPFAQNLTDVENAKPTAGYVQSGIIKQAMMKLLNQNTELADTTRNELLQSVNAERAKYGITPLRYNKKLEAAGQAFAHDMWKRGYFSHFTPEGESFVDRIRAAKYMEPNEDECSCINTQFSLVSESAPADKCTCTPRFSVGENIAKGQFTVKQVMDEWMNSPGHRKNILQPQYTEVGFGLYGTVWVQNFGQIRFD